MALTDADIIVSGGRGVGGPEGFDIIYKLADRLNGVVDVYKRQQETWFRPLLSALIPQ